jgi:hypothetical protein
VALNRKDVRFTMLALMFDDSEAEARGFLDA